MVLLTASSVASSQKLAEERERQDRCDCWITVDLEQVGYVSALGVSESPVIGPAAIFGCDDLGHWRFVHGEIMGGHNGEIHSCEIASWRANK
jgi:hypothetical protein